MIAMHEWVDKPNCTCASSSALAKARDDAARYRDALEEVLRVHADDNHRPKAFYIAAKALRPLA